MQQSGGSFKREAEIPAESSSCDSEGRGLLLHLLEYKAHLLEAVEELHIRRDAEARFEDQISQVVLEKQELEWEKESFQHQMKTAANQHTEALARVKKQLQERIRSTEEEREKFQVLAEFKEKEVTNLKEELKTLKLLKYSLEKKSGELEQKLALQVRSKESHLGQVVELEKHFSALSRQCTVVRQAHGRLEQKVDEAMKINKKLMLTNENQQATVLSLTQELQDLNSRLIRTRTSAFRQDSHGSVLNQQQVQQLQLKMKQQAQVKKALREENLLIRAEKQEVMKAMQQTQRLLLTQTQTVCRLEQELQVQEELHQNLQLEHQLTRESVRVLEEKLATLTETCSAAQICRDREKLLSRVGGEQQEVRDDPQKVTVQPQHVGQLQTRDSGDPSCLETLPEDVPAGPPGGTDGQSSAPPRGPDHLDTSTSAGSEATAKEPAGEGERLFHHDQKLPEEESSCAGLRDEYNTTDPDSVDRKDERENDRVLRPAGGSEDDRGGKSVEETAATTGEGLKNEGESEERRDIDVSRAAETRDTTDGGETQTHRREEERAEARRENTLKDVTVDTRGSDSAGPGTDSSAAQGGSEHTEQTEPSKIHVGAESDAFTDPGSSTCRHPPTEAEDVPRPGTKPGPFDWSADRKPTVKPTTMTSLQYLQDSRGSLPAPSLSVPSSAHAASGCWQKSSGGPGPDMDYDLSCSQERDAQQSTLRAQISRIEEFLSAERDRLSKRRRTEQ